MSVGLAHRIAGISNKRAKGDFYPTPPHATEKLLEVEKFQGDIWEPACGEGYISEVLKKHGYNVRSSDVHNYGYGETGIDFLFFPQTGIVDNIITNPPYSLAHGFVDTALKCSRRKVAMLMKINFLEGVTRKKFFESSPFARVYVFSRRISLTRLGQPMVNKGLITYAWFVWKHGYTGEPKIRWI